MSKIRVYELAKELNVSSKDLINLLMDEFSVEVKNHMSVIEDEDAALIKELLGDSASDESKKSLVDEYEEELAESLNKGVRKKKKTKKELEREEVERNAEAACGVIEIGETITVKELCEKLGKPTNDVIKNLIFLGVMAGVNQEIDFATAEKLCEKYEVLVEKKEAETELEAFEDENDVVEEMNMGLLFSINRELADGEVVDNIELKGAETSTVEFKVPEDAKSGDTIHIIVEAIDNGKFNLKHYQRVIITVE